VAEGVERGGEREREGTRGRKGGKESGGGERGGWRGRGLEREGGLKSHCRWAALDAHAPQVDSARLEGEWNRGDEGRKGGERREERVCGARQGGSEGKGWKERVGA